MGYWWWYALGHKWRKRVKATESSTSITKADQEQLWELPHHATQYFPEKLSLCIGFPVMLWNNDATELCITKGWEGTVAGWQSYAGPHGKSVLDTLFVPLTNLPHSVDFAGLLENVVPIPKCLKPLNVPWNQMKSERLSVNNVVYFPISPWQIMYHKARHDHTTL